MEKIYGIHGDVILEAVNEIPKEAKLQKTKQIVLADGEVSGHKHVITKTDEDVELYKIHEDLYIKNKVVKEISHEEHKTVSLPPGTWKVKIAKEYDHFLEESREVRD